MQAYRAARKANRPPLGARVSAVATWRLIRQLQSELLTKSDIARALGYQKPVLQFDRQRVTLRTALRVRRLCRALLITPEVDLSAAS